MNKNIIRKKSKKNNGITLVALVLTIIILIILAGISINIVLGPEGLIGKARTGTQTYNEEAIKEQVELDKINTTLEGINTGKGTTPTDPQNSSAPQTGVTLAEAQNDAMLTKTTNSTYTDATYTGTNKTVTIPAGYKMTIDTGKIEEGIVIEDANGNQFVWVPVNEEMAVTLDSEVELGGTGNGGGKKTSLKSKSELLSGYERTDIGATIGYREPDLVTTYDKADNAGTYLKKAGFANASTALADFADDLSKSYKNMIESVACYGGFYVGRYEITGTVENPTEKSDWPITEQNWYNLYDACRKFTTESATSRMMWGCTWDEICKFIANKGYTDENSGEYGNYQNVSVKANDGTTEIKASGTKEKLKTGETTFTKTCNIYDLAGNCLEYTQEVNNTDNRVYRGRTILN